MTLKNDKIRDLTPLITSFIPGESPTAAKLEGMIRQSDAAIEYIENKLGDLAGEESAFSTWVSTLARNIGDFSKLNPAILPAYKKTNYNQTLQIGKNEHELDLIPIGDLNNLIQSTLDSSIVISQWKNTVEELLIPGDWTIPFEYIENGNKKRGRKLITHAPSEGGSVIFKNVTSGRGSSLEGCSENTIPNLAQAENGGPFVTIEVIDPLAKTYQVTLPLRTHMYDKLGEVIPFSASNTQSGIGLNTQYELPPFFFGADGLALEEDDVGGFPKSIPLNLIKLYDWQTKKEVEGIIYLQADSSAASRTYQFLLQTKQDIILDIVGGQYLVIVPGNSIINQLESLIQTVYGNTGIGNDMTRLISHKNLLNLRSSSSDITNRSAYYGPSNISNNDHSMYFHRDGFTAGDAGAGGNVIRGSVVIGNTLTGTDDSVHENLNINADSYSLFFGNTTEGGEVKYKKTSTYVLDHSYGGLPLGIVDSGLYIKGAKSDLNPARKNIFLEGDIRTDGNIVLGKDATDILFIQSKVYVNDELTFIPKISSTVTGEEGKVLYDPSEKSLVFHNGSRFVSPWTLAGYTTVVGNGSTTFGKYNGSNHTPIVNAIAEASVLGGIVKILPGTYNCLGNRIDIPANVIIEGSGESTIVTGTGILFNTIGSNTVIRNLKITNGQYGLKANNSNCSIKDLSFANLTSAVLIDPAASSFKVLDNVTYSGCTATIEYSNSTFVQTSQNVTKSAINYAFGSTVNDWSNKKEILEDFIADGGMTLALNGSTLADCAIGIGKFTVTGNGSIKGKKFLPVNPNVGIGGHLNAVKNGSDGTISAGVNCYDANYGFLGVRYFIANSTPLTAGTLESAFLKGMMVGTSVLNASFLYFPANTRFVQPIITVALNDGGIAFDGFEITNMTYARSATWA